MSFRESLISNPLRWALSIAILAIAGFVCWNLAASHEVVKAQKGAATQAAHEEGDKTRKWIAEDIVDKRLGPGLAALGSGLEAHAAKLEDKTDRRLAAIEKDAKEQVAAGLAKIETQYAATLAAAQATAGKGAAALQSAANSIDTVAKALPPAIQKTGDAIEKTGDTVAALKPGFQNASLLAGNIQQAVAPNLECKGNGACWPTKVTAILGGTATAVGEGGLIERGWRKETPAIAANVRGITGNAEKISRPSKALTIAKYGATVGGIVASILIGRKTK